MTTIPGNKEIIDKLREVIELPDKPIKIVLTIEVGKAPIVDCEFYPVSPSED